MKIWFDISNSPHVNMWLELIRDLEKSGHEIIITSRPLANTIQILDQVGLNHVIVGSHYGKNLLKKILGFPIRVFQLWKYLHAKRIDLAVSQSSFHSPIAATLLGIPSIYTNDNEHALGNIPSFLFASKIFIPENMKTSLLLRLLASKTSTYPGIKEGIYLWRLAEAIAQRRSSLETDLMQIFVRPEPATAQYYKGNHNFLDSFLEDLKTTIPVTVLTRNNEQYAHYTQNKFKHVHVPENTIPFEEVASTCSCFIGAGGSMTREMAIVGVPTISVYQDELLEVDKLLLEAGLMLHLPDLNIEKFNVAVKNNLFQNNRQVLVEKGKAAYSQFINSILAFNK